METSNTSLHAVALLAVANTTLFTPYPSSGTLTISPALSALSLNLHMIDAIADRSDLKWATHFSTQVMRICSM